jgi:hypothetical protein
MSGRSPRIKGNGFEREVVSCLQEYGLAAERVPLSGAAGGSYVADFTCPVLSRDRRFEAKRRASGFKSLYGWLGDNFGLVVRDDRKGALVILRLEDFARLVQAAENLKKAEADEYFQRQRAAFYEKGTT